MDIKIDISIIRNPSVQFSSSTLDKSQSSILFEAGNDLNSEALDDVTSSFSYPEPILRAVNGARQGALAKSISNWHLIGHNEGCCSNTGYILLPCFYGIRTVNSEE